MNYDHIGGFIAVMLAILILYTEYRIKRFEWREWVRHLNKLPCKCGCKNFSEVTKSVDGGVVSEYEVICVECFANVNYWAYGGMMGPETYTECVSWWWHKNKCKISAILHRHKTFNPK